MSSDRTRILYYYSHQHFDTGSPKALVGMIELLDRRRFEPVFLADGDGPLLGVLRDRGVTIVRGDVSTVRLWQPLVHTRRVRDLASMLRRLAIDIVHINEFGENLDLAFAARLVGIPVILHIHNPGEISLTNLHWALATRVLFASSHALNAVDPLWLVEGRARVVYNSLDWPALEKRKSIRPALGLAPDDIVVGTVAQLGPEKGTEIVVKAARRLVKRFGRRVHFVLPGRVAEGREAFVEKLQRAAERDDIRGQVHFLGIRDDVPDILASLDIFFLPTQAEIFCVAVAEALAVGLPVVARRVGALPELIRTPEEGILLDTADPAHFADELATLIESPTLRRALGSAARAGVRGRFDSDACARQLIGVYDELSVAPSRGGVPIVGRAGVA